MKVLDKGYINLVDYMGGDLSIVQAARVSHDAAWRVGKDKGSDYRLIKYMLEHKHTSPFEHVVFTFDVKAPIFVFRQWQRHRTWSYNEMSARYTQVPPEFYVPKPEDVGVQAKNNKQARMQNALMAPENWEKGLSPAYKTNCETSIWLYKEMLKYQIPRELARAVLPQAMYSKMFATVDLHNLLHFIELRDHEGAQFEIREYAKAIRSLIEPIVPVTMEIWNEFHANASDQRDGADAYRGGKQIKRRKQTQMGKAECG